MNKSVEELRKELEQVELEISKLKKRTMSDSEFEYLVEKLLFEEIDDEKAEEIIDNITKAGRRKQLEDIINN